MPRKGTGNLSPSHQQLTLLKQEASPLCGEKCLPCKREGMCSVVEVASVKHQKKLNITPTCNSAREET